MGLCRMLFVKKANNGFRRPMLGATDLADWPWEPIELVQTVPFLITYGYSLHGRQESAREYLAYCVDNCAWSDVTYTLISPTQKRAALIQLNAFTQVDHASRGVRERLPRCADRVALTPKTVPPPVRQIRPLPPPT
jgi:hypothetical protein